jgi:outer membrane murein-binding lipoprotein Lpp
MQSKNVFDWKGPSVFTLDKKMKQIASGVRAGQLASNRAREKLDEKKQVIVYSKGKESV